MNDDLDTLIARYVDGTASPDEIDRLDARLARDPAAADEVYRTAYLEVLLRDAFASADGAELAASGPSHPSRAIQTTADLIPQEGGVAIRLGGAEPAPRVPRAPRLGRAGYRLLARRVNWKQVLSVAACLLIGFLIAWRVMPARDVPQVVDGPGGPESRGRSAVRLVDVGGGVMVDSPWGARLATGDVRLIPDEQVRTLKDPATLKYDGEATRVTLSPRTTVILAGGFDKRLSLITGRIECAVAKQSPDNPLIILTPQAQVTVVGTRFNVIASKDWTRLQVAEGTVRVLRHTDGARVDVSGGQYVDIAGADPAPPNLPTTPVGQDMGEFWSVKVRPAGIDR